MFGIRAAIPATSRLNVIKYANLASLLQTNELLGNYRNLFWFGSPIGLAARRVDGGGCVCNLYAAGLCDRHRAGR